MRAPRPTLRLAPLRTFGGRRGQEAIVESEIAHLVAKPPLVWSREPRANQPRAAREAASQRRKALSP